jgi:DNA-binding transcriptional LysR family regulator
MIDLDALGALRAVSATGSVVAAGVALGYTPSAVSQQVKRLERQIGLPLLERVGRGVVLTAAGRHLVEAGGTLLRQLEEIESALHGEAGRVFGTVRVAAFSTATRGLLAPAARTLADTHPDLALVIVEREPWDSIDLVATGGADLAVVHSWGDVPLAIPGHLVRTRLALDIADVIMPRDHPLAARAAVAPSELLEDHWIATPEGTICRQWLRRMHDGTGQLPRIAHESMEFESQIALVRAGLGIALVPRLGRSTLPDDLAAVPTRAPASTREITALHRESMDASPTIAAVIEALRAAAA